MITNFKLFESEDPVPNGEFVKGDYILIDISALTFNRTLIPDDEGNEAYGIFMYKLSTDFPYTAEVYFKDGTKHTFGFNRDEIIRKLTPKEIEDFELNRHGKKDHL